MAPDEGFEDSVASECYERAVVRMWTMVFSIVRREAVVKVGGVVLEHDVSVDQKENLNGLTCGLILSPFSVLIIFLKSQSLQV